jgi:hypothetical protein
MYRPLQTERSAYLLSIQESTISSFAALSSIASSVPTAHLTKLCLTSGDWGEYDRMRQVSRERPQSSESLARVKGNKVSLD